METIILSKFVHQQVMSLPVCLMGGLFAFATIGIKQWHSLEIRANAAILGLWKNVDDL